MYVEMILKEIRMFPHIIPATSEKVTIAASFSCLYNFLYIWRMASITTSKLTGDFTHEAGERLVAFPSAAPFRQLLTTHSTTHSYKICIIVLNDCFVMKFYNKCKSVVKLCARAQLLGVSRSILEIDEQDQ